MNEVGLMCLVSWLLVAFVCGLLLVVILLMKICVGGKV